ncbi:MAG: hypothetical protein [Bacteriophage sp.]|nr:MAG: hypothetical protein [Bacteriophage sp.]
MCFLVAWPNGSKAYKALQSHIPYAIPPNNMLHIEQRRIRSPIVKSIVGEYDAITNTSRIRPNEMIDIAIIVQRVLFVLIMF